MVIPGFRLMDWVRDDPSAEIVGAMEIVGEREAEAARAVVKHARDARLPPPAQRAVPVEAEDDRIELDDALGDIVMTSGERFPMTAALLGYHSEAPAVVRVDTADSYAAMRRECNAAAAALATRLDALEAELHAHEADPHAHAEMVGALEILGAEAQAAHDAAAVRLMLPPGCERKVDAWCDGDTYHASICLPAHDGTVRYATMSAPLDAEAERVTGYVDACGVEPADIVGALPALCGMMACGAMVPRLAAAASEILGMAAERGEEPFSCRVACKAPPSVATIQALAWAASEGNVQAAEEWRALAECADACPDLAAAMGAAAREWF